MKLDKDLVREILLAIEASDHNPEHPMILNLENRTQREVSFHVTLLDEAGLLKAEHIGLIQDDGVHVRQPKRLTYKGYEYLDTFRDGEVWRRTKAGAEKAGGAGMGLLLELGKAYAKQVLKERIGIELP